MSYLDNNATTMPSRAVQQAMRSAIETTWANPSSSHDPGRNARSLVESARFEVGSLVGCPVDEIVFTSGGTESVAMAIEGTLAGTRKVLVTSTIEHDIVRRLASERERRGFDVVRIGCDRDGVVRIDELGAALRREGGRVGLVSIMWANNETGAIQPVDEIGHLCRDAGVPFHSDGTQWVGRMPTDLRSVPIDLLSFSGHKFHGPKGAGALVIRTGARMTPILPGPQEGGRRGGTENVQCIAGLGAAAREASAWMQGEGRARGQALRDGFERHLREHLPDLIVAASDAPRLWNTSLVLLPSVDAERVLMLLAAQGVCASAGSACASGAIDPSPVLLAMGLPAERARLAVRFSLSRMSERVEVEEAARTVLSVLQRAAKSAV